MNEQTLTIHNIFGHGYNRRDLDYLEDLGFTFRPQSSSFAGSQVLRFLDFGTGPCLELIEVTDHGEYLSFVPPGMIPYEPGLNLGLAEDAPRKLSEYQEEFASWGPYLLHENYEGGQETRKPGWNYLNFREPILDGTFVFLTEFEKPYPASHPRTTHPNSVLGVSGLVLDLPADQLNRLSRLTGQPVEDGVLTMGEISLYSSECAPLPSRRHGPGAPEEHFSLTSVLVQAESLDTFRQADPPLNAVEVSGKEGFRMSTPPRSWDLVVHA